MGKAVLPFKNLFIASIFKLCALYYLTGLPHLGIYGAAAATAASFALMAILNMIDIRNQTGLAIDVKRIILKPLAAATAMAIVLFFSYETLSGQAGSEMFVMFSSMAAGVLGYMLLLIINGGIDKKDLSMLRGL
ncbi:MAG: polysaccharide biosynthesis C-terminal domain-containing protein [Candidatus Syntrophopropionicum ammoniitolerans]